MCTTEAALWSETITQLRAHVGKPLAALRYLAGFGPTHTHAHPRPTTLQETDSSGPRSTTHTRSFPRPRAQTPN